MKPQELQQYYQVQEDLKRQIHRLTLTVEKQKLVEKLVL